MKGNPCPGSQPNGPPGGEVTWSHLWAPLLCGSGSSKRAQKPKYPIFVKKCAFLRLATKQPQPRGCPRPKSPWRIERAAWRHWREPHGPWAIPRSVRNLEQDLIDGSHFGVGQAQPPLSERLGGHLSFTQMCGSALTAAAVRNAPCNLPNQCNVTLQSQISEMCQNSQGPTPSSPSHRPLPPRLYPPISAEDAWHVWWQLRAPRGQGIPAQWENQGVCKLSITALLESCIQIRASTQPPVRHRWRPVRGGSLPAGRAAARWICPRFASS